MEKRKRSDMEAAWSQWVAKGNDTEATESFEYMRRKLWCDMLAFGLKDNSDKAYEIADRALQYFDKRFGKGEGE